MGELVVIPYLVITLCCVATLFRDELTALGRVIVLFLWLMVTALWIATAHATTPTPFATPTPWPVPTFDPGVVQCVLQPGTSPPIVCCVFFRRTSRFAQGVWEPLGCFQ